MAHSTSCGPPKTDATWSERATRGRSSARLSAGPSLACELEDLAGRRLEHVPRAVDLAADQGLRPAAHRGDDPAVGAARDRIDAEHHAAEPRLDQRLDQHGDRLVGGAGTLA